MSKILIEQPAGSDAEPVAWRWLYNGSPDSEKCFPMPGPDADVIAKAGASEFPRTVQYLYTAPQPAAVPAGYALVPVEPTEAMLNAARDWSLKKYGQGVGNDGARGCYAAMLAAANKEQDMTDKQPASVDARIEKALADSPALQAKDGESKNGIGEQT